MKPRELGHHPEALGTHERALRSGGIFSRHPRKTIGRRSKKTNQRQMRAQLAWTNVEDEMRGVDSWAP